jgi:hypothetical protein
MVLQKAARATRPSDGAGPRKFAHTAKRRNFPATISRAAVQAHASSPDGFVTLGAAAFNILARLIEARS